MTPVNILDIKDRAQFRQWLIENHATERECWVVAKREKMPRLAIRLKNMLSNLPLMK